MADEENLLKELEKLQIKSAPHFILSKDVPVEMSPFSDSNNVKTSALRQPVLNGCEFRMRKSVLDRLKATKGVQVPKKSIATPAGYRRTILRKRVLKAFHSQGLVGRRYFSSNSSNVSFEHHNSHHNGVSKSGISDFHELITECCNVSGDNDANQKKLDNRILKNFTTVPPFAKINMLPLNRSSVRIYTRSRPKQVCCRISSTTNLLRERMHSGTNLPLPKSTASDPNNLTNVSHGNSCPQQAGSTATAICDDTTVNELASYFDTFVHIS